MLCNGDIDGDHPSTSRGILWQRASLPVQREREDFSTMYHHQPPPYNGVLPWIPPPVMMIQHPWILPFPYYSTMDHDWQQHPPCEDISTTPSPDGSADSYCTDVHTEHFVLQDEVRVSVNVSVNHYMSPITDTTHSDNMASSVSEVLEW